MDYDIIGDIHGHADELEHLLQKLGYRKQGSSYKHGDDRKVVFLGDFIDRSPKIKEVLHIAKSMVDSGNAEAIMGNHEFNAIAFHTPKRDNKNAYYRENSEKNISQHYRTLEQFNAFPNEWQMYLDWVKSLPIYIDLEEFRAVHACWNDEHLDWLEHNFEKFDIDFLDQATAKNSKAFLVTEELLKGKEQKLHDGYFFHDKDGNRRDECRVKWWQPTEERKTYGDVLMACPEGIANHPLPATEFHHYPNEKPVFLDTIG